MKKVLVAVDGSEPSQRAARYAVDLQRWWPQLEIHVLNVQPPLPSAAGCANPSFSREGLDVYYLEAADKALAATVAMLGDASAPHVIHREVGPVAQTIAATAHSLGCDQIVMGTHGRDRLTALLMGSVATHVVEVAAVPVTLVP